MNSSLSSRAEPAGTNLLGQRGTKGSTPISNLHHQAIAFLSSDLSFDELYGDAVNELPELLDGPDSAEARLAALVVGLDAEERAGIIDMDNVRKQLNAFLASSAPASLGR